MKYSPSSSLSALFGVLCTAVLTASFLSGLCRADLLASSDSAQSGASGAKIEVTTTEVDYTTASSTVSGGTLSGYDAETYGICWSTTEEPTVKDNRTLYSGSTESFTSIAGPLDPETTYYIRAYATLGEVPYYGEQVSVTTSAQTATHSLILHNPSSGGVVWWTTNNDNKLVSSVEGTGWGSVSDDTGYTGGWQIVGSLDFTHTRLLFWQNQESDDTVHWWRIHNETNKMTTDNNGEGIVSDSLSVGANWKLGGTCKLVDNALIWHDPDTGNVIWWKILSDGSLLREKQGVGWGYVNEEKSMPSQWSLVAVLDRGDQNILFWQNETDGTVAWWKINDSGSILDNTYDSGWGLVSKDVRVSSDWTLVGAVEDSDLPVLIWQNHATGKVVWWRLNNDIELQDSSQNSGWGFVSENVTVSSAWKLCKVMQDSVYNTLFWQNEDTGNLVWWKLNSSWLLKSEEREDGWGFVSDNTSTAGFTLSEVFE